MDLNKKLFLYLFRKNKINYTLTVKAMLFGGLTLLIVLHSAFISEGLLFQYI